MKIIDSFTTTDTSTIHYSFVELFEHYLFPAGNKQYAILTEYWHPNLGPQSHFNVLLEDPHAIWKSLKVVSCK